MIESVAKCAAEGRLVAGNDLPLQDHERGLRLLAAEPRVARRGLAKSLRDVFARSDTQDFYARHVTPNDYRAHGYVFLTIKRRREFGTEERYREFRRRTVLHYCETVKLRQPDLSTIIGLGFGTQSEGDGSIDMVMRTFDGWTEEDARRADEVRRKYGWSEGDGLAEVRGTEYEYPDRPEARATPERPANRRDGEVARRAKRRAQRAARKKNRR